MLECLNVKPDPAGDPTPRVTLVSLNEQATDPKSHTPVEVDTTFFEGACHLQ